MNRAVMKTMYSLLIGKDYAISNSNGGSSWMDFWCTKFIHQHSTKRCFGYSQKINRRPRKRSSQYDICVNL